MEEIRMLYRIYKQSYSDCRTVPGSYKAAGKTIIVLLPEGRMKASGVRGERYTWWGFDGELASGKRFRFTVKAITLENAIKRLRKEYPDAVRFYRNGEEVKV